MGIERGETERPQRLADVVRVAHESVAGAGAERDRLERVNRPAGRLRVERDGRRDAGEQEQGQLVEQRGPVRLAGRPPLRT